MKTILALIGVFAGGTMAQAGTGMTLNYECERGARIQATYLNVSDGAYAVLNAEGYQVAMKAESAGAGSRYVSMVDERPYVWWTKDNEGELAIKIGGGDIAILSDCTEQP